MPTAVSTCDIFICGNTVPYIPVVSFRYDASMSNTGIPTPNMVGVKSLYPSICSRKRPVTFYWFPTDAASDLEGAFEEYVAPQFESEYAATMAEEEFLATIERAKKGILKPVYEVKEINAETAAPERIFEIRNSWPNSKRKSGNCQYLGSRLFHAEPRELKDAALGLFLMAKKEMQTDTMLWQTQTADAIHAKYRLQECRARDWEGIKRC